MERGELVSKIDLEYPYSERWKNGYIVINPEGRKTLILYNSHTDRSSTQYARYLLSAKLGRYLTDDETVDHVDGDKTNDDINNLQLLSKIDNIKKENNRYLEEEQINYIYLCANCTGLFILTEREVKMRLSQNVVLAFCSRSCSSKYNNTNKLTTFNSSLNETVIAQIKKLREAGLSSYKISKELNIARNTVMKYW